MGPNAHAHTWAQVLILIFSWLHIGQIIFMGPFYMVNRHKLHIIAEFEHCNYKNVDPKAKKPPKFHLIAIILVRDFSKVGIT